MANKETPVNETQQNLTRQAYDEQRYVISQYLETLKFSPRMLGVDEADVWRKLEKLCELYEDALTSERMHSVQLEQQLKNLQQKYQSLLTKSQQLLEAYKKLAGEDRADD